MLVCIFQFFRESLKINSKIDEIIFFHFQDFELINCSQMTIRIVVHAMQIFNDIFDDKIKIFDLFSKTKF